MNETVIVDCPDCESRVRADILAVKEYGPGDDYDPFKILLLECPGCGRALLASSSLIQISRDQWDFDEPVRLWPSPRKYLDVSIPGNVRNSIEEGQRCIQAKAYSACAVMCGKALEALCASHTAMQLPLAKGLDELKANGIIDGRLYEWGTALRERRNIGAHASGEDISREDATDVLNFTIAICEYVYVLSEKFDEFKLREEERKTNKAKKV